MQRDTHLKLTSGEIAQIWAQYMNDSGSICMLTFFLEKVEDEDIKPLIEYALELSTTHIEKLTKIFEKEEYSIPHGFKIEEDVNLSAPKLYSDIYVLNFIYQMSKIGLTNYSASVSASVREDITEYYIECMHETMELYKRAKEILLEKACLQELPFYRILENLNM